MLKQIACIWDGRNATKLRLKYGTRYYEAEIGSNCPLRKEQPMEDATYKLD